MQDLLLGTYQINGPLTPGALYSRTVTISVPDVIYGNFSIVVITDSSNQVFEHISEDDNSKTSEVSISMLSRVFALPNVKIAGEYGCGCIKISTWAGRDGL